MEPELGREQSGCDCEFSENLKLLREIGLFSALPLEALKLVAYLGQREHFPAGKDLFTRGDHDGQAFYFLSGNAHLFRDDQQEYALKTYGQGDFIGGFVLVGRMQRLFTLRAATDVTCLVITREKFSRVMAQFPGLLEKYVNGLIQRVQSMEEKVIANSAIHSQCKSEMLGVTLL